MPLSPDHKRLADELRAWMSAHFVYRSDGVQYGIPERWAEPSLENGKLVGDCEDHAIYAYRRLFEQGVAREDMQLAVCRTETGEGHCVLLLGGEWVFDNRYATLVKRSSLPYTAWLASAAGRSITEGWTRLA